MIGAFQFEDGGRTYRCSVEASRGTPAERWWWFSVTGDQQRYAPFQAASGDTQVSVRTRVVGFYSNLLERRAMPYQPRHQWAGRGKGAPTPQK